MIELIRNIFGKDKNEFPKIEKQTKNQSVIVRKKVVYSGRVQGVGFRFEAYSLASREGITGYVMNKEDGTVLLEAQADIELVCAFIEYLSNLKRARVDKVDISDLPIKEYESDFKVLN